MRINEIITEAAKPKVGRSMQHAEDLVIVDGSTGALHALEQLESMASSVDDVTIKWDGSPAIYFGRNENGEFVLTDKSGFTAKGYDGKVTDVDALHSLLLNRGKSEPDDSRKKFARAMGSLWVKFESIVDESFRGYMFGDLLFFEKPHTNSNNEFEFTPNTVTYEIDADSDLGKRIDNSTAGVVVHHYVDLEGEESPIKGPIKGIDTNGTVLVVGPTTITEVPDIDTSAIATTRNFVQKNAVVIDTLLDDAKLAANKMSDFKAILYKFVNQQVKTRDFTNLNKRFDEWVSSSKVSNNKQAKIADLRTSQAAGFEAIFNTLEQIMTLKDKIIDTLDITSPVKSSIDGQPGGEGYVKGNIKLVPRAKFTAANLEKHA